jgi:hypothetical protein
VYRGAGVAETTRAVDADARVALGPAVGAAPPASRFSLLAPLRRRDYALLWGGNAVSLAGDHSPLRLDAERTALVDLLLRII